MPVALIKTTSEGPLFWYKQSCLLLHKDRLFAVDKDNYLGELMLTTVSDESDRQHKVVLTYPKVPFCPSRYLLRLQYSTISTTTNLSDPPFFPAESASYAGRGVSFYPMRHLPGDLDYIPHVAGRSRDFLTPGVRLIRDWMRDTARERIKNKILALAMGLHPRLGANSPLLELGSDLLWSVVIQS